MLWRYTDLHSWKIVDRGRGGGGGGGGQDFPVKLGINPYTTANTEGLGTALH